MRPLALFTVTSALVLITSDARSQTFDCPPEDFVCPRLAFTNDKNQPVTSLPAGDELRVAALLNWSRPGTYTEVVVRVDAPVHFRLGIADSLGSFATTCINDTATPQANWDVSCTFTHQGPLEPDVGTSTNLPLTFFAQRWNTPFGYSGDFTMTVTGRDPDGQSFSRTFSRALSLLVAPNLALTANIAGSGGSQTLFDHDNDPTTPKIKGRAFSTSTALSNLGSRTVDNASLSWQIPSFAYVTSLELRRVNDPSGYIGMWTLAPHNTAAVGAYGGVLEARFDGAELVNQVPINRFWPLARSSTLQSPSVPNNDNTPSRTSSVVIHYIIACSDLPTSTAAGQPTTRRSGAGLYLDADGETAEAATPPYDDPIWRWSHNGSTLAPPCTESWDRGTGARKAKAAYDYPPNRYVATGMTTYFELTLAAPDGIFEVGPTTIRETIPPYTYLGHTSQVVMQNPEFTTWFCKFDGGLASTLDSGDFANCPNGPDAVPCHGATHFYRRTDPFELRPDNFNPFDSTWSSTFAFNPDTTQGCVLAADVCNPQFHTATYGVDYGNANCTDKAFRADEVTHIYFTTWDHSALDEEDEAHLWRHPTDLSQRPTNFRAGVTFRTSPLATPPAPLPSFYPEKTANIENRMTIGGGLMQTSTCGLRDFAWFNRVCPPTGCTGCDDVQAPPIPVERVAYQNIDNRSRATAVARVSHPVVPFSLSSAEAAWVACRFSTIATPLLFDPSLKVTLPPGFRPRPGGADQRTGAPNVPANQRVAMLWSDHAPNASDALLSGLLNNINLNHNPNWTQQQAANITWSIVGPTTEPDGRISFTFTPSQSELNWQRSGENSYLNSFPVIVRVEPIPDHPFVDNQNYQGQCDLTARGADPLDPPVTSTGIYNLKVPMPAQMTVIGTDLCRAGSHHPTFDMVMDNSGGRNLVNAESIMLLPQALAGTALTFASATLDPEGQLGVPPAFALPLVEVTTATDLVARIVAGTTNATGVFVSYNPSLHNASTAPPITAIRLRYPGTQFLPAYAKVRLRVALQLQALSLGLVGEDLTTRAWFAAPGSGLPYAESFDFDPFEVGQCPTTVTAAKAFDANADGAPDPTSIPLANWPITLTVKIPGAVASAPTTPQTALTNSAGLATFLAYPGQTIELSETLPTDGGGASPDWLQTFPAPGASLGGAHSLVVGFEAPATPLLFLNTCQCEDDYTCSAAEDRCELVDPSAPVADQAICVFGAPSDMSDATSPTPIACREDDHVALVTNAEGDVVGAIRCRVNEGAMTCDTNPDGTLFIHTDRLECSR